MYKLLRNNMTQMKESYIHSIHLVVIKLQMIFDISLVNNYIKHSRGVTATAMFMFGLLRSVF